MTKALVIESKEPIRRLITVALQQQGMAVQVASQPLRAADMVHSSGSADIVLIDIKLPGVDGLELLRRIKKQSPDLPIVLLTARPAPANVRSEAVRLGVTVFRTEPFKPDELVHSIRAKIHQSDPKPPARESSPVSESLTAHVLSDLHDPDTGRLDAKRIAEYLCISLSSFAEGIGKSVAAVHKNPAAISLQDSLAPIARCLGILAPLLRSRDHVLAWLNSPHPDLGGQPPLSLILKQKATAVAELLEAAMAGQPS